MQAVEALHQKSRSDQKDDRQCHLTNHKQAANIDPERPSVVRHRRAAISKSFVQIRPRNL